MNIVTFINVFDFYILNFQILPTDDKLIETFKYLLVPLVKMEKIVWENKSNGQLCVTVPKGSGIKEGDIVTIEKEEIKSIVYTSVAADLFHYGQLHLLQRANELGDFHICGVMTDEAVKYYRKNVIASIKERKAIISDLRCVDMVVIQDNFDPTNNLKKIHEQFKNAKIVLVYGSNLKKTLGADYIKKINGSAIKLQYYEKLSTDNIIKKIFRIYKKEYGEK